MALIQVLSELPTPATLLLTDLLGRIIAAYDLPGLRAGEEVRLPMQTLSPGLYSVVLKANDHLWAYHLVRP